MSFSPARVLLPLAVVSLALVFPGAALADTPDCDSVSGGAPIIYGAGGSAQRDLVGKAAVILENSDDPVFVVYNDSLGACSGIDALTGLGSTTISGTAYYWPADTGSNTTCNLPLAGAPVDFAVMGVGPFLCPLVAQS